MKTLKNIKIQKWSFLSVGLVIALSWGSCKGDHEDIFEQSPSARLENRIQQVKQQLVSSADGWLLELASKENATNGAFLVGIKFNEAGWVRVYSEHSLESSGSADQTSSVSHYDLTKDAGVVISFSEYNEALHYYSSPDVRAAAGPGKGFEADYEFRVMESNSPDTIHLIGKKTRNELRLVRYKGKESLEEFIRSVAPVRAKLESYLEEREADSYEFQPTGSSVRLNLSLSSDSYRYFTTEEDKHLPIVYTPRGFHFLSTDSPLSNLSFTFDEENKQFVSAGGDKLVPKKTKVYYDYLKYVGDYTLTIGLGDKKTSYDIKLEATPRMHYRLTGLPYELEAYYDRIDKRVNIDNAQSVHYDGIGDKNVAIYLGFDNGKGGYGLVGSGGGMYLRPTNNSTEEHPQYKLASYGVGETYNLFVLLEKRKEDGAYLQLTAPNPTDWNNAVITKK